ncbi:MAG: hypothetical protein A2X56_10130 [Nitrospirae bacterium GWC2_57_13]|jgi:uncharacterized protein (TIGR02391 family)|nr:MAG: hypothetical protein A2072_07590 [Nitrospirae bacterium GWC1_57_7]OGW26730.1 MAG: hypothetical protein A2X56_10130 [Nitrospirae bacterium GWC2_57_13]OGW46513.1 MAG: hypothetical protein A2X57_01845 [Nitrospirae bacterium GWD2_57_8]HAR41156.1 hypothetical protein [Bdellovibrionales bacterium]HAS53918.1 hypothetical protein [Nitrospiraceae bacterium]
MQPDGGADSKMFSCVYALSNVSINIPFVWFKEVEIRVRTLSGMTKEEIGVPLMRKAFRPGAGPLIDEKQTGGEQQDVMDLFAGAIGSFKNPSSHRDVDISDSVETVELIGFADFPSHRRSQKAQRERLNVKSEVRTKDVPIRSRLLCCHCAFLSLRMQAITLL